MRCLQAVLSSPAPQWRRSCTLSSNCLVSTHMCTNKHITPRIGKMSLALKCNVCVCVYCRNSYRGDMAWYHLQRGLHLLQLPSLPCRPSAQPHPKVTHLPTSVGDWMMWLMLCPDWMVLLTSCSLFRLDNEGVELLSKLLQVRLLCFQQRLFDSSHLASLLSSQGTAR